MIYLNKFDTHASYEEKLNGGGVDISLPNVSYCEDVKDVHYLPYNLVRFYVGEITRTKPQTVKIYTDDSTYIPIQVSEGNKWYTYVLPKYKGLFRIEGDSVKKVVVKANINFFGNIHFSYVTFIPTTTVEASFKGSDTSKVTNMTNMFNGCDALTSLDLSKFDTSNVTSMNRMFFDCEQLKTLNLNGWNTSNVTNMNSMFFQCSRLLSLDVSGFDTSNVTNMFGMFGVCRNLTSLDLSNFNTSNVTDMRNMFRDCRNLTSLDVSNFNTSKVTDMSYMFRDCRNLTSLTLSGWDTSNVTNTTEMFKDCSNLKEITMKNCSSDTIGKIKAQLKADGLSENIVKQ